MSFLNIHRSWTNRWTTVSRDIKGKIWINNTQSDFLLVLLISSEKWYLHPFLGQCYMYSLLSEQQEVYWEGERTWSY